MNRDELLKQQKDLIIKKMKLDKFFTMYLDKFSNKMDPSKPNTNIWKLYNDKMKEYSDVDYQLKVLGYYLAK